MDFVIWILMGLIFYFVAVFTAVMIYFVKKGYFKRYGR
jgi:hypothetical protein